MAAAHSIFKLLFGRAACVAMPSALWWHPAWFSQGGTRVLHRNSNGDADEPLQNQSLAHSLDVFTTDSLRSCSVRFWTAQRHDVFEFGVCSGLCGCTFAAATDLWPDYHGDRSTRRLTPGPEQARRNAPQRERHDRFPGIQLIPA